MTKYQFPKKYFGQPEREIPEKQSFYEKAPWFRRLFFEFIESLPKNAKVLDAGCGHGKFLKMALSLRPDLDVYAMDISDVGEYLPKNVSFKIASVEDVGELFQENFFDAIFCFHVLEHLLYPTATMAGFKKVLKNGGRLYLETPNWTRVLTPFSFNYYWGDYTHVRVFSKVTIRKMLGDYGFPVIFLKSASSVRFLRTVVEKGQSILSADAKGGIFARLKKIILAFLRAIPACLILPLLKDTLIVSAVNNK